MPAGGACSCVLARRRINDGRRFWRVILPGCKARNYYNHKVLARLRYSNLFEDGCFTVEAEIQLEGSSGERARAPSEPQELDCPRQDCRYLRSLHFSEECDIDYSNSDVIVI